jgi:nicotinamide riboside kinase
MSQSFVVALLGAESTGKSTLSWQLADALRDQGYRVQAVSEYLREWCDTHQRVPLPHEQAAIANVQTQRISALQDNLNDPAQVALHDTDVVIADTTALMTAVYSDFLFGDPSLYAEALTMQSQYNLTLLMGLDMPWVADGLQRDGPHVRSKVDDLIRQALQTENIAVSTVYGLGDARLQAALAMVLQAMNESKQRTAQLPQRTAQQRTTWQHFCDCCGDGVCEQRLFTASRATLA